MMVACPRGLWVLALVVFGLWSRPSAAHEFRPAVLNVEVDAEGEVAVRFVAPAITSEGPTSAALYPVPPEHCTRRSALRWSCGSSGLTGTLAIAGLAHDPVDVLVAVRWPDGSELHERLGPRRPSLSLGRGVAADGAGGTLTTYFTLGSDHIARGLDHLLFLLALLLLGGRARDHLRTITAFTVGHALTLMGQAIHPIAVPGPWVEACIVASIAIVAAEAHRPRSEQAAWSVALGFGLIHGLGFAGALAELGLPASHRITALLGFNLGVEAGQLAVVLVLLALATVWPRASARRESVRRGLAFAVGCVAVAWTFERVSKFWS